MSSKLRASLGSGRYGIVTAIPQSRRNFTLVRYGERHEVDPGGDSVRELGLALLGPPVVTADGVPVSFDTRKATAVLALLAVTGRR